MLTAFATDDGNQLMTRHFGDARFYDIYQISETETTFKKRIANTTEHETEVHADPEKAKGIARLLHEENVRIVVSRAFGPNIQRIKKKFVCILMSEGSIEDAIELLQQNFKMAIEEWEKGEARNYLSLRKK